MLAIIVELAAFVAFGVLTILAARRRSRNINLVDRIPGPPALPILGNVLELNVSPGDVIPMFIGLADRYGPILRFWVGLQPVVMVSAPQYAECILSSNREISKSKEYSYIQPWLGRALLITKGTNWHMRRKLLTPAFHFKILSSFVNIFNEQSSILIDNLQNEVCKTSVDICPFIARCSLDIICESSMGRHVNAQGNPDSDYMKAIYRMQNIIHQRQRSLWLQPNWLFNLFPISREHDKCLEILHGFTTKVFQERKHQFLSKRNLSKETSVDDLGRKHRLAFLDLLLETSANTKFLSDSDICEEIDSFMLAGHDAPAIGISWALYCMSCYPDLQEKVYEELQIIFGNSDRIPTIVDIQEMKYLECCIKESLRLYPSIPLIGRELAEDMAFGKFTVPKGTTVAVSTYLIHRNPEYFPDPEEFKPERFFPENSRKRHPYVYIPFSAGPRNCIGQRYALLEAKVIISSVLRRFKLTAIDSRQNLTLLGEVVLRSQDGLKVKLCRR